MKLGKNKGFTLIEVIVVVALLGIILSIAAPSFNNYRHRVNFREAARDFSSEVALYRQRAIAENLRYRIVINVAGNNYTVEKEDENNIGTYNSLFTVSFAEKSPLVSIQNVTATAATITLQPRGTANNSTVTLRHAQLAGGTADIIVNYMGRIRVEYANI